MSTLGSPSGLGLVSAGSPSTQTCTLPSGSFSDSRLPLLTRILTASTEVPKTSAASCTVSLRLVIRAPPTGLPFGVMLAPPEGTCTGVLHGQRWSPERTRWCMLACLFSLEGSLRWRLATEWGMVGRAPLAHLAQERRLGGCGA